MCPHPKVTQDSVDAQQEPEPNGAEDAALDDHVQWRKKDAFGLSHQASCPLTQMDLTWGESAQA